MSMLPSYTDHAQNFMRPVQLQLMQPSVKFYNRLQNACTVDVFGAFWVPPTYVGTYVITYVISFSAACFSFAQLKTHAARGNPDANSLAYG